MALLMVRSFDIEAFDDGGFKINGSKGWGFSNKGVIKI